MGCCLPSLHRLSLAFPVIALIPADADWQFSIIQCPCDQLPPIYLLITETDNGRVAAIMFIQQDSPAFFPKRLFTRFHETIVLFIQIPGRCIPDFLYIRDFGILVFPMDRRKLLIIPQQDQVFRGSNGQHPHHG